MAVMKNVAVVLGLAYGIALSFAVGAEQAPGDGPRYTKGRNLVRPADYREWPFLSSGLGMTYQPTQPAGSQSASQFFTNVFVNPSSYRSFMRTGKWPDSTILVLEVRQSDSEGSINKGGRFQTGFAGLEAHVKDSRFPDGWAFFNLGKAGSAEPLSGAAVATCVECHTKNAAVERTFVQFYPTLLEVARQKGTLKPGF
jgi:hypothetical protein